MNFLRTPQRYQSQKRSLYCRCKGLDSKIAVVGTRESAAFLLDIIGDSDLPLIGVFERERFFREDEVLGHRIRPLSELKQLSKEDTVIIASSAEASQLYDTFQEIRSLCSARILTLKSLLDINSLRDELKDPLGFQFDEFIFSRGYFRQGNEYPWWQPAPPNVSFKDKTVLELGPFEGHQTVMIMSQQPKKVIGLEARPLNYAKIAVTRSLYNWPNYDLRLGDMHLFPELVDEDLDIIFCAGVHYHSDKPWWLLQSCMERCDTIILCGHVSSEHSPPGRQFREVSLESGMYNMEVYPEFGWGDGLSGVTDHSLWFTEKDLIRFLDYYGFGFEKYNELVNETGLWILSVVKKK